MMLLGLLTGGVLATGWVAAAEPPAPARLILEGGQQVIGEVVHATRNTLTVRRAVGGVQQVARSDLARIEITTEQGASVAGAYAGWRDGRLAVDVGDQVVWVERRRIVERVAKAAPPVAEPEPRVARATPPADAPPPSAPPGPVAQSATPEVRALPAPTVLPLPPAPVEEEQPTAVLARAAHAREPLPAPSSDPGSAAGVVDRAKAPAPDAPVAGPEKALAALEAGLPTVTAAVPAEPVLESAGEVVFELVLSRAADQPVSIVYATVDGDAVDGEDYMARQGVLTIHPGSTSGEVRAALLDDDSREPDEKFHLFLSAKPDSASVPEKWLTVVIQDDDGPDS